MEVPDNEDLITEELVQKLIPGTSNHEDATLSLEVKALCFMTVLFLFLLSLIALVWNHYHLEIQSIFIAHPTNAKDDRTQGRQDHRTSRSSHTVKKNNNAYTALPTFIYERPVKCKPE